MTSVCSRFRLFSHSQMRSSREALVVGARLEAAVELSVFPTNAG